MADLKLRVVPVNLFNGKVISARTEGTNAAWMCICGDPLPLVGRFFPPAHPPEPSAPVFAALTFPSSPPNMSTQCPRPLSLEIARLRICRFELLQKPDHQERQKDGRNQSKVSMGQYLFAKPSLKIRHAC
jgi:hypothetical protein